MVSWQLRWLRHILCTRQSGMQPLSHVITPPSHLSCLSLLSTTKDNRRADERKKTGTNKLQTRQDCCLYHNQHFHRLKLQLFHLILFLWGPFISLRRTSVKGAAAEEQGATSAQLPLSNSRFYIPPLISIKITVIRQHARHEVDEAVEWREPIVAERAWRGKIGWKVERLHEMPSK